MWWREFPLTTIQKVAGDGSIAHCASNRRHGGICVWNTDSTRPVPYTDEITMDLDNEEKEQELWKIYTICRYPSRQFRLAEILPCVSPLRFSSLAWDYEQQIFRLVLFQGYVHTVRLMLIIDKNVNLQQIFLESNNIDVTSTQLT